MKAKTIFFALLLTLYALADVQAQDTTYYSVEQPGEPPAWFRVIATDSTADTLELALPPAHLAGDPTGTPAGEVPTEDEPGPLAALWAFVLANWQQLLFGFLALFEVIVRLTPTEKDNNLLRWLQSILDAILPNRAKGGGRFVAFDNKDSAPRGRVVIEQK